MGAQRGRFATFFYAFGRGLSCPAGRLCRNVFRENRNGYEAALTAADRAWDNGHLDFSEMEEYLAALLQAQLEDEGLVRIEELGDRRTFVLTDAGRARVDERRGDSKAPWEQMTETDDADVGALFLELRRLGMAAGQIGHLGSTEEVAGAREIIARARRALYSLLSEDDDETNE